MSALKKVSPLFTPFFNEARGCFLTLPDARNRENSVKTMPERQFETEGKEEVAVLSVQR
jgi:hypothetical protein